MPCQHVYVNGASDKTFISICGGVPRNELIRALLECEKIISFTSTITLCTCLTCGEQLFQDLSEAMATCLPLLGTFLTSMDIVYSDAILGDLTNVIVNNQRLFGLHIYYTQYNMLSTSAVTQLASAIKQRPDNATRLRLTLFSESVCRPDISPIAACFRKLEFFNLTNIEVDDASLDAIGSAVGRDSLSYLSLPISPHVSRDAALRFVQRIKANYSISRIDLMYNVHYDVFDAFAPRLGPAAPRRKLPLLLTILEAQLPANQGKNGNALARFWRRDGDGSIGLRVARMLGV